MKAAEIRELSDEKIAEKMKSLYQESFNLRFQQATSQLENTARIRMVRKDIARIKTIIGARSLTTAVADKET
ncbi:MAG: 50S ribosomal protein L29 [Magnetococcales bacterium]|nr:50S ribosomal protein L29 [Magnetococcales bacterium]